ncbi:ankyrin repeat domain-containing protein 13C-like [Branchiostoma floridae]|uniref:Ankyrin repeat domain-containing protein 13C-like n=1 Tax=Branchiostoma floridae TaxID=7739 RepID=A0A9J7MCJ3_BRAFL|nr:ankyrin repeat domain-containing protein 13C-like [Branchiostoma floridae]
MDTTLVDFMDMSLQRGDLSFIFNGHLRPNVSLVVLDNELKVFQRIRCEQPCVRRESIQPPPPSPVSWDEYVTAPSGRWPHLGRPMVVKETRKSLKATVAMSEEFPIRLDRLLDVLEIIAPFKHFLKLREFIQLKLPSGFPVKIGQSSQHALEIDPPSQSPAAAAPKSSRRRPKVQPPPPQSPAAAAAPKSSRRRPKVQPPPQSPAAAPKSSRRPKVQPPPHSPVAPHSPAAAPQSSRRPKNAGMGS